MAYTNIDDPSAYFQTKTYTGNGSNGYAITNDGNSDLQPDLWWVKNRDKTYDHNLYDSTRGTSLRLVSNSTTAEATATDRIASFDTNGFTLNGSVISNENNNPHVAWQWKANGGTTSSNTDGTLTGGATVQANTDAGFSIITYTGTSQTNPTVGHGLNQAPELVIVKNRDLARNWAVGSTAVGWTKYLELDTTDAEATNSGWWGNQDPTSTTVGLGTASQTAGNTYDYVMYAFHSVQGYSKFGKYVGNGNADGPFVYTGFKPAFVMIKNIDNSAGQWYMYDNKRDESNVMEQALQAQGSNAEITTSNKLDFVSNGIKHRGSNVTTNQSGSTHIYMAFAENPFVTSTGIPTTAR
jgi:hypothetical protein